MHAKLGLSTVREASVTDDRWFVREKVEVE